MTDHLAGSSYLLMGWTSIVVLLAACSDPRIPDEALWTYDGDGAGAELRGATADGALVREPLGTTALDSAGEARWRDGRRDLVADPSGVFGYSLVSEEVHRATLDLEVLDPATGASLDAIHWTSDDEVVVSIDETRVQVVRRGDRIGFTKARDITVIGDPASDTARMIFSDAAFGRGATFAYIDHTTLFVATFDGTVIASTELDGYVVGLALANDDVPLYATYANTVERLGAWSAPIGERIVQLAVNARDQVIALTASTIIWLDGASGDEIARASYAGTDDSTMAVGPAQLYVDGGGTVFALEAVR